MKLDEFREHASIAKAASLNGREYCKQYRIPYHQWIYWNRKLREHNDAQQDSTFFKIESETRSLEKGRVTLLESPTGWKIHVDFRLTEIVTLLSP